MSKSKRVTYMVNEEKIKLMTKMAIYESNEGVKDLEISHFDIRQYVTLEMTRSILTNSIAFLFVLIVFCVIEMEHVLKIVIKGTFGRYALAAFLIYLVFILITTYYAKEQAKQRYKESRPRIKEYKKNLNKLHYMYEVRSFDTAQLRPEELKRKLEEEFNADE